MTALVTVGGLTLDGTYRMADGVLQVGPRFFSDWYSVPESKVELTERPTADGAFDIDQDLLSALPLQLDGWYRGADWASTMNTVIGELSSGRPLTVSVADEVGSTTRQVSVRRFIPRPNPGARMFEFTLIMVALDPRRYGPHVETATGLSTPGTGVEWPIAFPVEWGTPGLDGRAEVANDGYALSWPVLEVTGGLSEGVELVEVETGSRLRLDRPIPDGSRVVFDSRSGRVYLDVPENDVTGFLTRREWWPVPGQTSRAVRFLGLGTVTGTPILTVRVAPAY